MLAMLTLIAAPPPVAAEDLDQAFDRVLGTNPAAVPTPPTPLATPLSPSTPAPTPPASSVTGLPLEASIAALAEPRQGRIGVAATDLVTGRSVMVLGDQPFPLASTGKVAIVATFLDGVDAGRFHLDDLYPLMIPLPSAKLSGAVAPKRPGAMLSAQTLIDLAITRSDNHATDALLAAIGGPGAVDRWLRKAGITGMRLDRDIATLVRDDGIIDPATTIDTRDSTTPLAMVQLLAGLWQGQWLSPASREVLIGAMRRCQTGVRRLRAAVPDEALVGHKTGTLNNTSSDVGLIRTPDGHTLALAIYVTGQGGKPGREMRIAAIARAIYEGYQVGGSAPASGFGPRTAAR